MQTQTLPLSPALGLGKVRAGWSLWRLIRTAWTVMTERQALAELSDEALADIGVTRADAAREAARPVWDLPANR